MGLASSKDDGIGSGQIVRSKKLHHGDDKPSVIGDGKPTVLNAATTTSTGATWTVTGMSPRGQGDAAERRKDEDAESQLKQLQRPQQQGDSNKKTTGWTRTAKNRISLSLGHLKRWPDRQRQKPTMDWSAKGVPSPGYAFDKSGAKRIEVKEFVDNDRSSNDSERPVISSRRFDRQQFGVGPTELYRRQHLLDEIPDFDVIGGRIEFSVKKLRNAGTKSAKGSQAGLECSMNPVACKLHRREKPTHSHHTASDCLLKVDKYDEIWASPYPPCPSPPPSVSGSSDEKEQQDDVNVVSSASDSGRHQLQQLKAINALVTSDERMPESIDDEPAEPDPSSGDLPDEWSDCWNALIATSTVVHGSSGGSGDIVRNYEPQSTMPLPVPATTSCVQHETSRTDAESIGFGLQQQQQFPRSSAEVVASTNCMATQLSELYFAKTTSYAAGWKNYMTVGRDNEGNTNNSNDDDKRKMEAETQNDVKDDPEAAATTAGEVRSQDVHRDLLSPQPPQSEPEDAFPKEVVSDSASAAVGCVFVEGDGSVGDSSPQTVDRWVSSIKHSQNSDVPERTSNGLPPVETL